MRRTRQNTWSKWKRSNAHAQRTTSIGLYSGPLQQNVCTSRVASRRSGFLVVQHLLFYSNRDGGVCGVQLREYLRNVSVKCERSISESWEMSDSFTCVVLVPFFICFFALILWNDSWYILSTVCSLQGIVLIRSQREFSSQFPMRQCARKVDKKCVATNWHKEKVHSISWFSQKRTV